MYMARMPWLDCMFNKLNCFTLYFAEVLTPSNRISYMGSLKKVLLDLESRKRLIPKSPAFWPFAELHPSNAWGLALCFFSMEKLLCW